ncbi:MULTISPECIES: hypothetical protein [Amycolatopsis]|uniref:hypothetical protein n=1 Tax=Amycolatopsis TaxID=1813 RepID=UPI000B8A787A|nr:MULTISPECIES: hypothetical protein [Amycolatopsis]OXM74349.1 hypothetical protein CF166_05075 [Amycolatopsis sp. KNN50.9b]
MNPDDELGDELRRLFDDDRLAITPAPGAESTIVRGARRRRRQRTAVAASGGVLTAVLLVTLGLVAERQDPGVHQAARPTTSAPATTTDGPGPVVVPPSFPELPVPPAPPTSTTTATPAPPPSGTSRPAPPSSSGASARPEPATTAVLGPTGYRQLRLGMSFDEAKATGMLADADTAPTECIGYRLIEGMANIATVTISPADGVVVFAATGARTPENVGIGSTVAELRNAYPDLTAGAGNYRAATGSGANYTFYVDSTDTVVSWELGAAPGC